MKTFAQFARWRDLNAQEQAWEIFSYLTDYETGLYPMGTGAFEGEESVYEYSLIKDPVKMINGYSVGYCDVFGPVMAGIWEGGGLGAARVIDVPRNSHVMSEVYFDDAWHYLDLDLRGAFNGADGSLASMEQARNNPALWERPNSPRFFPLDDLAELRDDYVQSDLRYRYGVAETGHTMDFVLRQGESFTRWWQPQDGRWLHHPNYDSQSWIGDILETEPRGPKSKHASFSKYTHGNGQFVYQPNLTTRSSDFADGLFAAEHIAPGAGGLVLSEADSGYAIFEVRTPYVIVPLVGERATTLDDAEASVIEIDADHASYSVSLDNGITWQTVQAIDAAIDLTGIVDGHYGYLFKIDLNGLSGDAIVRSLKISTWVQLAPASLPSLRVGSNKMQFKQNDHYGLATRVVAIIPDTADATDLLNHVVVEPTAHYPESVTSRIHGPFVVAAEAPPNTSIAWFSAGASFETYQLGFAPFTQFTMEYAVDLPFGFTQIHTADIPDDMEHWHTNAQAEVLLDEPADIIYVRYEGEPAVNNIRIYAHVVDDTAVESKPVNITHQWIENGQPKEFSTRSDQGNEYFIDVDSDPVHVSVTMSVDSDLGEVQTAACEAVEYLLKPNLWSMISLPCDAPAGQNNPQALFGDDITGNYGESWIMFGFSTDGTYRKMDSTSDLEPGTGYWIAQTNSETATLDFPAGSSATATVWSDGCVSAAGCVAVALNTNADAYGWTMAGNPFDRAVALSGLRIQSGEAAGCMAPSVCDMNTANENEVAVNRVFVYTSEGYVSLTQDNTLDTWNAGWWASHPNTSDTAPGLLLPMQ